MGKGGLDRAALMDPQSCVPCHPQHVEQWEGSMHAYAAHDPVFRAMNRRGQEETAGALGDFCVKCHAPLAVAAGATTDGLNLEELEVESPELLGVTCFFCHSVVAVEGTHNNPLVLADDDVLRGGILDPLPNGAHASVWSPLHDGSSIDSAALCGACHDIITPAGVALERTFAEWKGTLYSEDVPGKRQTCVSCHMQGSDDVAAIDNGAPVRRVHDHSAPGVDVALTPFPNLAAQAELIERDLDNVVLPQLCVATEPSGTQTVVITLENLSAGHAWPSGAAQDRRAWVEVVGRAGGAVIFESGVLPEGVPLAALDDPQLWRLGDRLFGEDGEEVHMFWEATSLTSNVLPGATAFSPTDPAWTDNHIVRTYQFEAPPPDEVSIRVHVRPMGLDVLQDLVASGHLEAEIVDAMPTWTLEASQLEWREEQGQSCVP